MVLAIAGYWLLFYSAPLDSTTRTPRWLVSFVWLLQPEQLLAEWVGNDASRFGILDRIPILLTAVAILGVAYLAGRVVLAVMKLDRQLDRLEVSVLATGVGSNILSLGTLGLGLAGQLHNRVLFIAIGLAIVAASAWKWKQFRVADGAAHAAPRGRSLERITLAVCVIFAGLILLGGMLPPWHFDVREYHLQVPKEWYLQGSIGFMPHNVYGNMPLGAEMPTIIAMAILKDWWLGALVGKTIIAAFAPLTAVLLFVFGRRFFSPTAGLVAAAAYLSTPWTARVSMAGLIEGPYGFYMLAAVFVTLLAIRPSGESEPSNRFAALAGFLAGAAVSCKYPALLFVVTPLAIAVTFLPSRRWQGKAAAAFALAVAAGCGPWLVKNHVLTGNPTYPLLYSIFDGATRTPEKDAQWTRAHGTPAGGLTARGAWNEFRVIALTSKYHGPLLVPLAVLGLLVSRRSGIAWSLAVLIAFVVVAWWLLTHRVDRFLFPLLPLVALLAGLGATWSGDRMWRAVVVTLLVLSSLTNFATDASRFTSDNRFLVALADLRLDLPNVKDPPEQEAPRYSHTHQAHRYLNQAVKPGHRVLVVGEAQVFDLEAPVLYNTCFDDCIFEQLMKDRTTEQRRAVLRELGISHVFIFWRELDRYRSPGNYGYSDYVTRQRIRDEFLRSGLFREVPLGLNPNNSQLFEVMDVR